MRIAFGLLGTTTDLSPVLSAFAMMVSTVCGTPVGSFSLVSLPLAESAYRTLHSENGSLTREAAAPLCTLVLSHCVDSGFRRVSGGCGLELVVANEVCVQESKSDRGRVTHDAAASLGIKPTFSSSFVAPLEVIVAMGGSAVCDVSLLVRLVSMSSHFSIRGRQQNSLQSSQQQKAGDQKQQQAAGV